MRGKNNFSDVILACEDGQEFAAQKMILGTFTIQPFLPQVVKGELTKAHQPNSLHEGSQVWKS